MDIEKMKSLRSQGLSYKRIGEKMGCSPSKIRYHLDDKYRKRKLKLDVKYKKENILLQKLNKFLARGGNKTVKFTQKDLLKKIGDNPKCYLTGVKIDLKDSSSYQLDHIIPVSLGGENSLENCGLTCPEANMMKHSMTLEQLYKMCSLILKNLPS